MQMKESIESVNSRIWNKLYDEGKGDLIYPSDVFIRCCRHYLGEKLIKVLDYGFGTGANTIYLAKLGHQVFGAEVSATALHKTKERLFKNGLTANLSLIQPGQRLPFEDETFDAVIAWCVLTYNDWGSVGVATQELSRVLKAGGVMMCATAAPGDITHSNSIHLGDSVYQSTIPGQEGCIVLIPEKDQLTRLFPGQSLELGEFSSSLGGVNANQYIIVYQKI